MKEDEEIIEKNMFMTEEFLNLMDRVNGTWQNNFKVYFSNNEADLLLEKDIRGDIRKILKERNTINSETDKVATEISRAICNKNWKRCRCLHQTVQVYRSCLLDFLF